MKKIAVVLSGCGFKDGAEITEAVSTLIALSECGAEAQCFAPEKDFSSVNHINDQATETRQILAESSRISRGQVRPLQQLDSQQFDGVIFPGGFWRRSSP